MARTPSTGSGVVLDLIRSKEATTRSGLIERLGWSRVTLARRLDELLRHGIIVSAGQLDPRGGRPPEEFAINKDAGLLLAVDIGGSHTRLSITDLVSTVLSEDEADIGLSEGPDEVFTWASQVFDHMLGRLGRSRSDVRGIGVGAPGPVDPRTGRLSAPQLDPQWTDVLVSEYFQGYSAVFAIDRDVNTMAIGESRLGWPEVRDIVLLKLGSGVGCALVLDGVVYRGARGGAGDFAHGSARGQHRCRCGRVGCLDSRSSGLAIRRDLIDRGYATRTSADIVSRSREGDPLAAYLLAQAGQDIGSALADLVGVINPKAVVIGGDLSEAGSVLLDPLREALFASVRPFAAVELVVERSRVGPKAGVRGAALIAQDALFEADRISELTRGPVSAVPLMVVR